MVHAASPKKIRNSFLKKRTKKLLVNVGFARQLPNPAGQDVFFFFFSKKKRFTCF
jgi:hypothetical protein